MANLRIFVNNKLNNIEKIEKEKKVQQKTNLLVLRSHKKLEIKKVFS